MTALISKQSVLAFLCVGGMMQASAQDVILPNNLPPEILEQLLKKGIKPPNAAVKPPAATPAAAAEVAIASPEDQRLQQLLQLPLDRRSATVFQALNNKPANPALPPEILKFHADILTGRWDNVGEYLGKLPPAHSAQVYQRMLTEFLKTPPIAAQPGIFNQQTQNTQGEIIFSPEDVIALSEIAPSTLTDEQTESLGKLLGFTAQRGNLLGETLQRLQKGTKWFGGTDPVKRQKAALLLTSANRNADALTYLGTAAEAIQKKDVKTLETYARVLSLEALQTKDPSKLSTSWEINQALLANPELAAPSRDAALSRNLELLPLIRRELGMAWLSNAFQKDPAQGMNILAALGQVIAQNASQRDVEKRRRDLSMQQNLVDQLLQLSGTSLDTWKPALRILAVEWVREGELSKARFIYRKPRDPYNYDQNYYLEEQMQMMQMQQYPNQSPPIPIDQLLLTAPQEKWLQLLDASLAPRIRILMSELNLKIEQTEGVLAQIEKVAVSHPKEAHVLAQEMLKLWTRTHDPNPPQNNNRNIYYINGIPSYNNPQATALTRAMQDRNVQELGGILKTLRSLSLPPMDTRIVVDAFTMAHSRAEVYRQEDIENVFGKISQIEPKMLSELLQAMRQRLGSQWRQVPVQQQAKTRRNDKEMDAEINRGYQVGLSQVSQALETRPIDFHLLTVQGSLLFDWAEYLYGKKVDLAIYTQKRDQAFQTFQKAALEYAKIAASLPESELTPLPYQQWFNSLLGASDLAFLTRQHQPETNRLEQVRQALYTLPQPAQDKLTGLFAKSLSDNLTTVPSELKPKYVRAAMAIVASHPNANEIRRLSAYYADLVNEVQLHAQVDGDTTVGHQAPFGLIVSLRYTESLGRESGNFIRYLQNQQGNMYAMYQQPGARGPVNYRDDFEKRIRETMNESFEILGIVFVDDKVQPRNFGKAGWRETPYAYIAMKARDAAVDKIPSLTMDLDFSDNKGTVILPISSEIRLVDARPNTVPPRPLQEVSLTQVLDDRKAGEGELTYELKASGKGLLPEAKELVELSFPGLTITKTDDNGLSFVRLDHEGDEVAPVTERNVFIQMKRTTGVVTDAITFQFPKPRQAGYKNELKRYADADLVVANPSITLKGLAIVEKSRWPWFAGGGALVLLVAALILWLKQNQKVEGKAVIRYTMPEEVNPVSVFMLLKKIHKDSGIQLPESRRGELEKTIKDFEKMYFSPRRNGEPPFDLEKTARDWISVAG